MITIVTKKSFNLVLEKWGIYGVLYKILGV